MPTIPNFPAALLEEHSRWHHVNHQANPTNLPPGYGERFLQFHRNYIARALQWYNQMGYDPHLVEPWQEVPSAIRNSPCYNQAAERRIRFNPQSFATADELGAFIEASNIHGCIHQESARIYEEPEMNDFDLAPRNTLFYNIHTMIDGWYQQWERTMGIRGTRPAHTSTRTVIQGSDARKNRTVNARARKGNKLAMPVQGRKSCVRVVAKARAQTVRLLRRKK
ncbi:hypothetical protein [Paenibacillus spongiae]|uniref:Tyrosinase copper-binding domain-containing protein n=1 Tax=Paenibacillus spongiae TaxID=2909671 RepID=A0ABY5SA92_9BACL|nr:hypothetical protein [Paenibacillus spongiae]UVI30842.1 hypothetical protein L1F29_02900 [Paenibacillus spongiae]